MANNRETIQFFHVLEVCPRTGARVGELHTSRGPVMTPVFMPVGSQGTVKTLTPDELKDIGVGMVLANTYHLYLRPGLEVIEKFGGLHQFMSWDRPILTDSGGFQIFSLGHLCQVSDEGVRFRSHIDGSERFLTPELAVEIQEALGAEIIMPLDECASYGESADNIRRAMERSYLWARRCRSRHERGDQALFGIVHGGAFPEMRRESAASMASLGFPGYAIGGLSLGEPKGVMLSMLEQSVSQLPSDRPRYLMGVGSPEDLVECVARGVDMFDSALPTRVARNGGIFSRDRRYSIGNARFRDSKGPLDVDCDCYTCRNFSAGYLHHLFKCRELLGYRLATIHNLRFIAKLMLRIREAVLDDTFVEFKKSFLSGYQPANAETRAEQKLKWLEARQRKQVEGSFPTFGKGEKGD